MSNQQLFANNAVSTLAAPATALTTSLTITLATNFPFAITGQSFFTMTLADPTGTNIEIVYCTNRAGTVLTVMRGQEGTQPIPWSAGATVYVSATAGTFQNFLQGSIISQGIFTVAPSGQQAYTYNTYTSAALEAQCQPKDAPGSIYRLRAGIIGEIASGSLILAIDNQIAPVNGAVVPVFYLVPDAVTGIAEDDQLQLYPYPFFAGMNFCLTTSGNPYILTLPGSGTVLFNVGFL